MFTLGKNPRSNALAGVYINASSMALATVVRERGRKPRLIRSGVTTLDPGDSIPDKLRTLADGDRATANFVLADGLYQLLLVEAPRVEPAELRAAIRWKIRSLIDFHIDDAVIDVFDIPGQEDRPRGQAMMYAVVAHARDIRGHIDTLENSGLRLDIIDITDMAMRNLAALLEEDVRGVACLCLNDDHGVITITRQGALFLSRRLDITAGDIARPDSGAVDQVVLEVQRSLDYYHSHFNQPPVNALAVLPGFESDRVLTRQLGEALNLDVSLYDIGQLLECEARPDGKHLSQQLLAIGGALRREAVSL